MLPHQELESALHALIMEEDAWIAIMIEDALADIGYDSFDVASSCEEAIAMAKERCPDLITSDVRLGGTCGIETVRTICSDRHIPVVFVTAHGWEVRHRNAGLAMVQKPFGTADLKAAIGRASVCAPAMSW